MEQCRTLRAAAVTVPIWPVLQVLLGMLAGFASIMLFSKLAGYALMRLWPQMPSDTAWFDYVAIALAVNIGIFVMLRRRTRVFAAALLAVALLLSALAAMTWFAR